jgi:aminopeptidase N
MPIDRPNRLSAWIFCRSSLSRWSIVSALASAGHDDGLIEAELARDPTDLGQRHAAAARAARPDAEAKRQAWTTLIQDLTIPLALQRAIMRGFQQADQRNLLVPYVRPYFDALDPVWKARDIEVALAFARGMYPSIVIGQDVIRMTDEYLRDQSRPGPLRRILLEGQDQMQRAIRARAADARAADAARVPVP